MDYARAIKKLARKHRNVFCQAERDVYRSLIEAISTEIDKRPATRRALDANDHDEPALLECWVQRNSKHLPDTVEQAVNKFEQYLKRRGTLGRKLSEAQQTPYQVVVEVSGGVAAVTKCPSAVRVTIIDHDNEEIGEPFVTAA